MEFNDEVLAFMAENPYEIAGVFGDEVSTESGDRGGSEKAQHKMFNSKGKAVRDSIRDKLDALKFSYLIGLGASLAEFRCHRK